MGRCIAPGAAFNALDPGVLFDDLSLFLEATGGASAISGLAISCALSSETFFLLLLLAADASVPPRASFEEMGFLSGSSATVAALTFFFASTRATASASHAAFTLPRAAGGLLFHSADPSSLAIRGIVRSVRIDVS